MDYKHTESAAAIGERVEMQQARHTGISAAFSQQQGGTMLGFLVGLIVGLAIAVVVAMLVTKSSIPFSGKQGSQGKNPEPTSAQTSDPNKPLYGNNAAAKEAAKEFAREDGAKSDKPVDAKVDVKKDARADVKKDVKKEARSEDKPAEAKKDAKAEAARDGKADDKWTYYLQTNAYREAADAESERAKLALTGFEARVSETMSQGKPLYRVRMGPFANVDTMNRVRGKLSDSGINAAVVRAPK